MKLLKSKLIAAIIGTIICVQSFTPIIANATPKEGEQYTLTIVHTNDIHGHVDNLPKYSTIIKQVKEEAENVLVLDGGDIFLRGEFEKFQGNAEMEMLNAMGYDAWVLGNNDFRIGPSGGTTIQGNEQLQNLIKLCNFSTLCANVKMKDSGNYIENVKPYEIKNVNGMKIGIIGVTSLKPQNRNWEENSDKIFESGEKTVANIINEVNEQSDINIVLSHTGLAIDTYIANIEGVSAVLGADDHFKISEPIYTTNQGRKNAPITQNGGEENHYIGRLDLQFKYTQGNWKLTDFNGFLYDLNSVTEDSKIKNIINKYRNKNIEEKAA